MKKILSVFAVIITVLVFSGCYEQVPAGTKGKILGTNGFQPEIYPPSKVWTNTVFYPEYLYTVDTTTQKFNEPLIVKLKDDLDITTEIIFRGRVKDNDKILNVMFNDIPLNNNDRHITTAMVYNIYAKQIIMNTARQVISQYNVSEVMYMVGFTHNSYFSRAFKAKYGLSPKDYQRSKQTKEDSVENDTNLP